MFQSFTGSSRRPRQVNLSGRNSNPFAAYPTPRHSAAGPGSQITVANAQHERLLRQQERDRLNAAKAIQRNWRGYRSRREVKGKLRREWDHREGLHGRSTTKPEQAQPYQHDEKLEARGYVSETECMNQLELLLHFAVTSYPDDVARLDRFAARFLHTFEGTTPKGLWPRPLRRLATIILDVLLRNDVHQFKEVTIDNLLSLLAFVTRLIPKDLAQMANRYYQALANLTIEVQCHEDSQKVRRHLLVSCVLGLLQPLTSRTLAAYEGFATCYLITAELPNHLGDLSILATSINYKLLASSLASSLRGDVSRQATIKMNSEERLWLLAYFIHLRRHAYGSDASTQNLPDPDYIAVVSILLCSVADEISPRIDLEDTALVKGVDTSSLQEAMQIPLPQFVRKEILSLINQGSITSLLAHTDAVSRTDPPTKNASMPEDARLLAGYALTLLRVFPRRGDDIRMWLYLGSALVLPGSNGSAKRRLPAIKYFWKAAENTNIFESISRDPRAVLSLLRSTPQEGAQGGASERDQEWMIILLFLELYTFVLKVMDDEEFLSGGSSQSTRGAESNLTWTRESALPLRDVLDLTAFLKNFAFTVYWNASDLSGPENTDLDGGIGSYFSTSSGSRPDEPGRNTRASAPEMKIAGVTGMSIDYLKGMVTGLLRMVYERDSRRKFLPKAYWLMTRQFDMEGFIPAVVVEEEKRHQVQEANEGEEDENEDLGIGLNEPTDTIIGTRRTQQTRNIDLLRRQQRKASRKKYLEAVAPRLEILQNMPFFIPFPTRVQIFREFVTLDQMRRRGGHVDPDNWRMSVMQNSGLQSGTDGRPSGHDIIDRHHAKIRRDSVFEDAYEQFYELGEGLKEPIQITFVDKFGTVEAGIDGGGVTKEFLTSVTNEAFSSSNGLNLFIENDQNLLYPNPAAVDERKDILRQAGFKEGSIEWNEQIRELLRRYEFLGRVIGKCLYEGILVDIGFAGFFLLKWALTGGSGSASRESGYRANLNDLRDLDEGLYQGLLQLKDYPGNVEDFSLNFTVTDTISTPRVGGPSETAEVSRTITRDLKPNGSNIPVTNENRLVYISYIARHRLQIQPHLQTNAFLRGLGDIIQPSWLSMFNQSELQTLVGGDSSEINIPDLRRNTLYGGVYVIGDDHQEHPTVQLFWQILQDFSDTDRRKVLKFVTSTPRAPLLGFGQLNPRFSIRDAGDDQTRLPSTSTCVNLLKLPRYSKAETLREKLLYSVNSGAGFDLS
ncbi:MAG: hypothetical protein M1830_003095 [Pleopsidium flavum]|nr:MAG: hypothetical protein M1830_003095 [Pleopsidium flavum]